MKKRNVLAVLICLTLVLTAVTACAPPQEPQSADKPGLDSAAPQAQPSGERIEVVYWHTYTDHHEEALKSIIDGFNASQEQYTVIAEQQPYSEFDGKLMQAMRNGTGPDIVNMFPSDAINYVNDGLLVDLGQFINDPEIGIANFRESIPEGQYAMLTQWGDGGIYLFPCTMVGEVLFYNKTMFDKHGIPVPKTWTDMEEASKIIYEAEGIPGFGTDSVTDTYQCLIAQAGSGYINAETMTMDIDETIAKEKLNWFADGVKEGYFRLVGEDMYFSNPFGSQAIASYIGSSAGAGYVEAAVGGAFEVGCAPIPQEGPVKYISQWGNTPVCLSKDLEHARGAYEFLKYFTSTEVVIDWAIAFGSVPVFEEAMQNERFQEFAKSSIAVSALTEEAAYVGMLPSVLGANNVRTEIDKLVQNVALGVMDTDTAYAAFIEASQAALGK